MTFNFNQQPRNRGHAQGLSRRFFLFFFTGEETAKFAEKRGQRCRERRERLACTEKRAERRRNIREDKQTGGDKVVALHKEKVDRAHLLEDFLHNSAGSFPSDKTRIVAAVWRLGGADIFHHSCKHAKGGDNFLASAAHVSGCEKCVDEKG